VLVLSTRGLPGVAGEQGELFQMDIPNGGTWALPGSWQPCPLCRLCPAPQQQSWGCAGTR